MAKREEMVIIYGKYLWIINTSLRTFWREHSQNECIDNRISNKNRYKYAI